MSWIILGVVILLLAITAGYFVVIYNGLIIVSQNIDKAWANIEVLLKQRHDEIPKLLSVVESYMQYEKTTLQQITAARTACLTATSVKDASQKEGELTKSLKSLFAVAENYPDLKANNSYMQLQTRISYLESQIADRREFYNDSVNSYNIRIQEFPDMIVANNLGLQRRDFFRVNEEDKQDVDVTIKLPK